MEKLCSHEDAFDTKTKMENFALVAENVILYNIPLFRKQRKERVAAEKRFNKKYREKFEKAEELLKGLSSVATEVFQLEISAKKEINVENYHESLESLCDSIEEAYWNTFFVRRRGKVKNFRDAMERQFEVQTEKKDSFEGFQTVISTFKDEYLHVFEGVEEEYNREVRLRRMAEKEAESKLLSKFEEITTKDLGSMWKNGREDEVIKSCITFMIRYEAKLKGVSELEITEVFCHGEYSSSEGECKMVYRVSELVLRARENA